MRRTRRSRAKNQQIPSKILARYILSSKSDVRITLVRKTGWHRIEAKDIFVLPRQVIGETASRVIYDGNEQRQDEYAAKGTLNEWRELVSIPAGVHSLAVLAISAGFAGPLLHVAGQESGGIHIFGNSSTGKTTLLRLAASVWGDSGLVNSWRATSNGIEGVANRTI